MEYYHLAFFYTALAIGILALYGILKRANNWFYAIKLCSKKYNIPPGDMGWPYFGNTLTYFKSFIGDRGYTIPKGWKFFVPIWNVHMDPNVCIQPEEFNPSRWDDMKTKPRYFLPFSMGPKACPGSNLAKLQISVMLHYFLLYYTVEQVNPETRTYPAENCLVKLKKLAVSY